MPPSISPDILNKETDARMWQASGYKVGQKLDPNNPADKPYIKLWNDAFRKVKAEADAGKLVTTYDHPEVSQHLFEAAVANKVAAAHADNAAATPDPATAQGHAAAAVTATKVFAQKVSDAASAAAKIFTQHGNEAAAKTVPPKLVQEAGKEAIKTPPHPSAPAADHIAHVQAIQHADGHHLPQAQAQAPSRAQLPTRAQVPARPAPTRPAPTREALYRESVARFMRYRPGHTPNMSDARDRQIWEAILQQVQREAAAAYPMQQPYPYQYPAMQQPYPTQQPYPYQYPAMQQPYPYPYPPTQQPYPGPQPQPHMRGHRHHHQHPEMDPTGPQPAMGPQAAPAPEGDPGAGDQGMQPDDASGAPPDDASGAPSPDGTAGAAGAAGMQPLPSEFHPEEPSSIGKYVAIGAAVLAGGGLLYYVTKHKSSGKSSPSSRPARAPAGVPPFSPARAARA